MVDCKMKLVSVIIPTYSRPKFLPRAIESVLVQTYPNIEVIVVDDNGDGTENQKYTESLIRDYIDNAQITYIKHDKNRNGSAARNTGFKHSHGDYIAFLDDDDQFLPTKIEKQVCRLDELSEDYGACYCNWAWYDGNRLKKVNKKLGEGNLVESMLLMENYICGGSSLLIKSSVYKELNGFDESFRRHQDWELLIRFFRKYKIALVNEVLLHIHIESRVFTSNPKIIEEARLKYLETFKQDINSCTQANKILMLQYHAISIGYINNGNFNKGFYWFKKASKHHFIGFINLAKFPCRCILSLIRIAFTNNRK